MIKDSTPSYLLFLIFLSYHSSYPQTMIPIKVEEGNSLHFI